MRQIYVIEGTTDPKVQEEKMLARMETGEVGFVHLHREDDPRCVRGCHSVQKKVIMK